ncbi:hypothetical protein HQ945_05465 [Phyllobacterium sp. BT25]|uniref:Uncharacterized protein n=1 Tax=Phyllobacterium pellucidum TaxID=2740464 RepID=A0A849VKF9_9HYPH|nr:hypothetical protein [Phyllobacterium pellucidum]NTS30695.1 hypothetical protein [Phyllobacterium pellucidum]
MAGPSENLGEISTGLGDVSDNLGDSAHMVDHMSEPLNTTETATKHVNDGANNQSDGDHEVDDWSEKRIGFLVEGVLSSARKTRKKTGEANAAASPVSMSAAPGGVKSANNPINRLAVRARMRKNGVSFAGHANENFRAEKQIK